ncbi:MAG: ExbD/TolR family protein [Sphingomonadales bacterium]
MITLARGFGLMLVLAAAAFGVSAAAQDDDSYDVVIEIADASVTYNGAAVHGMIELEEALVEDVQVDPQLTVEVIAHDSVPYGFVLQVMQMVRQYEVDPALDIVPTGRPTDDNM